ncbi:2-phosphosulfolactate phosphatase [soil metagenome]
MTVEVYLTARAFGEDDLKGKTALVVDVLRASTTIVTALNNGARAIVPVADMAEAGKMAANLDPDSLILAGERGGVRIEGYHAGNSPAEFTEEAVRDKTIILNTTNGTLALHGARNAAKLAIGSFPNATRAAEFLAESDDVVIICGGSDGRIALEDVLCAGFMVHYLTQNRNLSSLSDAAQMTLTQYRADARRIPQAVRKADHARRLIGLGFDNDITDCVQLDTIPVLPIFKESRLVLERQTPAKQAAAA